jgi:tetratricopeptide (TPR) repeat protein
MFELKPIASEAIPRALERAERYRLLNEPRLAESICLDVLAIQPDNQIALSCLLLALTDQFGHSTGPIMEQAKQLLPRFDGAYEKIYYAGIISERFARQQLLQSHPGANFSAYEYLREAIQLYDRADALAPENNDDAILRHNTCVRMIQWHRLIAPHREEHEQPLE